MLLRDDRHRLGALAHPVAVGRPAECVLHHRVHRDEGDVLGQLTRGRASRLRQSISTAECSAPKTEMYWSMMPHGMPTKLRSARWQRRAIAGLLHRSRRPAARGGRDLQRRRRTESRAVRHGAADQQVHALDRITRRAPVPAPRRSRSPSSPWPACRVAQGRQRRTRAVPCGFPNRCAACRRGSGAAAMKVASSSATGRTKPRL